MMKTPDEIKKGLEICIYDEGRDKCVRCPYFDGACGNDLNAVEKDALALIQQLESENAELIKKVEQLQTVGHETEELLRLGGCDTCKYRDVDGWIEPCMSCMKRERWEMRKGE